MEKFKHVSELQWRRAQLREKEQKKFEQIKSNIRQLGTSLHPKNLLAEAIGKIISRKH